MNSPETVQREQGVIRGLDGIDRTAPIQFVDSGWTSRVYLINDGRFVFKFPRAEASKVEYKRESPVLELLNSAAWDVQVPKVRWIGQNYDFIGYEGVQGSDFSVVAPTTSLEEKVKIGCRIGSFLRNLHSLEFSGSFLMTVDEEISEYQYKYSLGEPIIKRDLSEDEQARLKDLVMVEMPNVMRDLGGDYVLCHGDLGYWNLVLRADGGLGVIDFGDAGRYDRSKDFIGLQDPEVLDAALDVYGDTKLLRDKIHIRKRVLHILELPFFIGKADQAGIARTVDLIRACLDG